MEDRAMFAAKANPSGQSSPATGRRARVLLLEDDAAMRSLLAGVLRAEGYLLDEFPNGLAWLDACKETLHRKETRSRWQVIISDLRMPGLDGLSVLRIAASRSGEPLPPVILITAFGDEGTYAEARRFGAAAVLDKPFRMDDLVAKVRELAPPRGTPQEPGEPGAGPA